MKSSAKFYLILVTTPNRRIARRLARNALAARLIACANIIPKIESHYWWDGRIQSSSELLLLLKTSSVKIAALEKLVLAGHPYDTPEFIVLPLAHGNKKYFAWMSGSIGAEKTQ